MNIINLIYLYIKKLYNKRSDMNESLLNILKGLFLLFISYFYLKFSLAAFNLNIYGILNLKKSIFSWNLIKNYFYNCLIIDGSFLLLLQSLIFLGLPPKDAISKSIYIQFIPFLLFICYYLFFKKSMILKDIFLRYLSLILGPIYILCYQIKNAQSLGILVILFSIFHFEIFYYFRVLTALFRIFTLFRYIFLL